MRSRIHYLLIAMLVVSPLAMADEAADRAAIDAAAQAWTKAFNARNADALLALTTEDVVLMDPVLSTISSRDAVRSTLQRAVNVGKEQLTMATKEVVVAGDVAWRIAALTRKLPTGEESGRGQSLEIWKRVNGQWKMHRQMSSALLAAPRLLRPPPSEPALDAPRN